MPYRYLEDIALADAAFEAWGESLEEMFVAAAEAAINIMVGDISAIRPRQFRHFRVEEDQVDMLLFQLLQALIYYKDAEQILFLVRGVRIKQDENCWFAFVEVAGESIDPQRHNLIVDVKAITLHNFEVRQIGKNWIATVTVDV